VRFLSIEANKLFPVIWKLPIQDYFHLNLDANTESNDGEVRPCGSAEMLKALLTDMIIFYVDDLATESQFDEVGPAGFANELTSRRAKQVVISIINELLR
jgi:hypothetical protein